MAARFPFSPFPIGWFFVCYSHELPSDQLFSKTFMGKEIVAYRGADGVVHVSDAHCPHLGAHMGKGGTVEDGCLRCPFHGFRFDGQGQCVGTPYGPAPAQARLGSWPSYEAGGFVFAWFHPRRSPPSFVLPAMARDGFGALRARRYRLRSHPQETTENGVDPAHLGVVHGYHDVRPLAPLQVDGPYLTGAYTMRRDALPLRFVDVKLESEFRVHVWGLGYSNVEVSVPRYGISIRQWIFSTPSDGEFVDLHIAARVRPIAHPERIAPGFSWIPPALTTRALSAFVMHAFDNDILQDFDIWQNKTFVARPALAKGDGPIGTYRRYCQQFYEENAPESSPAGADVA